MENDTPIANNQTFRVDLSAFMREVTSEGIVELPAEERPSDAWDDEDWEEELGPDSDLSWDDSIW